MPNELKKKKIYIHVGKHHTIRCAIEFYETDVNAYIQN